MFKRRDYRLYVLSGFSGAIAIHITTSGRRLARLFAHERSAGAGLVGLAGFIPAVPALPPHRPGGPTAMTAAGS